MNKPIQTLVFAIIALTGCESLDIAPGVPKCLVAKTKSFKKRSPCDTGNSVKEYKFQDKTVYMLSDGNCYADSGAEVIDSDCMYLGNLGGLTGSRKVNGVDFYTHATLVRTVWEN
ncbi:MAG: DUF6970 domain-containing protein [Adhaeribacter sp.]